MVVIFFLFFSRRFNRQTAAGRDLELDLAPQQSVFVLATAGLLLAAHSFLIRIISTVEPSAPYTPKRARSFLSKGRIHCHHVI